MITKEYMDLISMITENTKSKKIVWEETDIKGIFRTRLGQGYITIEKNYFMHNTNSRIIFSVINEKGVEAKSISCNNKESDIVFYNLLHSLYNAAKSSYLKVNETLDSMFEELNSLEKKYIDQITEK